MRLFHFIITNQDGEKKYITSLLFKQLFLSDKNGAYFVPKSFCLVSSKRPVFALQKQLLTLLFEKVVLPSNAGALETLQQGEFMGCSSYVMMSQEHSLGQATQNSEEYISQRLEIYLSIFFNHLYYNEEVD